MLRMDAIEINQPRSGDKGQNGRKPLRMLKDTE